MCPSQWSAVVTVDRVVVLSLLLLFVIVIVGTQCVFMSYRFAIGTSLFSENHCHNRIAVIVLLLLLSLLLLLLLISRYCCRTLARSRTHRDACSAISVMRLYGLRVFLFHSTSPWLSNSKKNSVRAHDERLYIIARSRTYFAS